MASSAPVYTFFAKKIGPKDPLAILTPNLYLPQTLTSTILIKLFK